MTLLQYKTQRMLFMEKYYPQVLKTVLEIYAYLGLLNVNVICRLVSSIQRFYGSQMGF